jgi:hypothetical protein
MRLRAKNLQVVHKVVNKLWNGIRFRTQMPKIFALSERKRRNWLGNGTDHEAHMRFRFCMAGFGKILCCGDA